jgi:hypothetical protein
VAFKRNAYVVTEGRQAYHVYQTSRLPTASLTQNAGHEDNPRFVRWHQDALGFRVFTGARRVSSVSRRQR